MYFDQKGPLIFSASIHFAVVVFFLINSMIDPEKPPEEMVFELVASATAPPREAPLQDESIEYVPDDPFEMPIIPDEEPPVIPVDPPVQVARVEAAPVEPPPKPKTMSADEFFQKNPIKRQNIPPPKPPKRNDLSKEFDRLQKNLAQLNDIILPSTVFEGISPTDQDEIAVFLASLKQAIYHAVESHPVGGEPLKVRVSFYIVPNGRVSGAVVVGPSGDVEFDRKVLDGFRRLKSLRAPSGWTETKPLTWTIIQSN